MIFLQNAEESCTIQKFMVLESLNFRQNGQIDPKKQNFGRKSKAKNSDVTPYHRFLMIYAGHY